MNDTYYLKIEVSLPTQVELIDSILEVKHDEEETGAWVLSMDYEPVFGDLPIFYISNFIGFLKGKYEALEQIGITRDKISIWRCVEGPEELFMEYWPEEMRMMAEEGIRVRIMCRANAQTVNFRQKHFDC